MIEELPNPDDNVPMEEDEQTLRNELLIQAEFTFFIFVNPSSGGNLAADFLELGVKSYYDCFINILKLIIQDRKDESAH